jgi:putative ATP-binding cassette transporter
MSAGDVSINRLDWRRSARGVRAFLDSEVRVQARLWFGLLIALLLAVNGLNVVNSFVGRDFMTAIESRDGDRFLLETVLYLAVFALSTAAAVHLRYTEERLGLLWREWLTARLIAVYLGHRGYYRLKEGRHVDNPDQRIHEDVRAFTSTTLSFFLMFLNGAITVAAFSGVLWSISPILFLVCAGYAVLGSLVMLVLGRRLIGLNYRQLGREADFRADLIHVWENAESVAILRREGRLGARLGRRLEALCENLKRIIVVNRNLGFFATGYNYLTQIIPALVVAPLFMRGEVEFGVITQSAMAFAHLVGAFSLVVTQFGSLSSFAAVVARLGSLGEAMEQAGLPVASCDVCIAPVADEGLGGAAGPAATIEVIDDDTRIAYQRLSLCAPGDGRVLIADLTASIAPGTRVLVLGSNEDAKTALFRATAGVWDSGEGRVYRPGPTELYFLPERPYLPPGTLREVLVRTGQEDEVSEERIRAVVDALDLDPVLARAGGLDVEGDWDNLLSLGEQQRLAVGRVLLATPRFVFLERLSTALGPEGADRVLAMLSDRSITYLSVGRGRHGVRETDDKLGHYDALLELLDEGRWRWQSVADGEARSLPDQV